MLIAGGQGVTWLINNAITCSISSMLTVAE